MAEETDKQEGEEEAPAGGGMMKKLIIAGAALVLVGIGAFAGLQFMGGDEPQLDEDGNPIVAEEEPVPEGDGPAFYTSLAPPLVVNFKDKFGDGHVMQVSLDMMARDQATINEVREHMPVIRSALILLYSGFIYEDVSTVDGKQKMLDDGLKTIRDTMTRRIGKPAIEEIYFTGLVIQ